MEVGEYLSKISSIVNYPSAYTDEPKTLASLKASTAPVNVIFPKKDLVKDIFESPTKFMFMSHVRKIETTGFPDASNEDKGLYSICVSHRSGRITSTATDGTDKPPVPSMQTVHLVSLEGMMGIENTLDSPYDPLQSSDRIGMVSLFSWNYLCTPPSPNNFLSVMTDLAEKKQVLRPPNPILGCHKCSIHSPNLPSLYTKL